MLNSCDIFVQIDEISLRLSSSGPAMQMLARRVALATKKLEGMKSASKRAVVVVLYKWREMEARCARWRHA